jgi:hypothetical protein
MFRVWPLGTVMVLSACIGEPSFFTGGGGGGAPFTGGGQGGSGNTGGGAGAGGGAADPGFPCPVARIIENTCQQCHGEVLQGTPMHLLTRADLTAKSLQYPDQTVGQRCIARMTSSSVPMPPYGTAPVDPGLLAYFMSWVNAGMPAATCQGGTGGGSTGGAGGAAGGGGFGGSGGTGGGAGAGPVDAGQSLFVTGTHASTIAYGGSTDTTIFINPDTPNLYVSRSTTPPMMFPLFGAGEEPSSIALAPSETWALVTLRQSQRIVRINGLPFAPVIGWSTQTCSEPTGVALTPDGSQAVVACLGEPVAELVETQVGGFTYVPLPAPARTVAITADGHNAWLPAFFGVPLAEASNIGRAGRIFEVSLGAGAVARTINGPTSNSVCAPNLLSAIAMSAQHAFVASECIQPQGPVTPSASLASIVTVFDIASGNVVDVIGFGSAASPVPSDGMAGIVDIDVDPYRGWVWVLAQGADAVVALQPVPPFAAVPLFGMPGELALPSCMYNGMQMGPNMCPPGEDLIGEPLSLRGTPRGWVQNEWAAHLAGDVNLQTGQVFMLQAEPPPPPGPEHDARLGNLLFHTATGRWSARNNGSCASCHPDGLSDNVTWMFTAGPRQTIPLDGTFAKGDPADHRAQNWTANFDEIADVEGLVRKVLGGTGALVFDAGFQEQPLSLSQGITLDGVVTRNDNLSGSSRAVESELCELQDWAKIELYIQSIRSNRAPTQLDAAQVLAGRAVFIAAGCDTCHAGPKWTVSRVPYTPSPAENGSLPGDNGLPAAPTGLRTQQLDGGTLPNLNRDTLKVAVELATNPDGGAAIAVGPERITCVLRDVGTHLTSNPIEHKSDGSPSQGELGYNIPSLLGLATSAPYFHDGRALTLLDLLGPAFSAHTNAGGTGYVMSPSDVNALVVFLESIDAQTPPISPAAISDICGGY